MNNDEVIVRFDGRMGNQMFQWAFARAYEAKNGIMPIFDDSYETLKLQPFNLIKQIKTVKKPFINKILRKIIPIRNLRNKLTELKFKLPVIEEETYYKYEEKFLTTPPPAYFRGYFQCEKYFTGIRNILLDDFKLIKTLNKKNLQILEKIKSTNSISLHIRRCDYLKSSRWGVLDLNYYKNAIKIITDQTNEEPTLFIFSDDINWVKNNMPFEQETVYVDVNSGKQGYFDLELMKNCKHNIIANSSFSWWGGWLNENSEKIVVAPKPWRPFMKSTDEEYNLLPSDWQRCDAWKEAKNE